MNPPRGSDRDAGTGTGDGTAAGRERVRRPRARLRLLAVAAWLAACGPEGGEETADPYELPADPRPGATAAREAPSFVDVTRRAGIEFVHENGAFGEKWMPETVGSGAAFLDWDGDGWPDLLLVNGSHWPGRGEEGAPALARLYRNLGGGRFEDVTSRAGLREPLYGMGASAADYDADGDLDVYLTAVGRNRLLRNDGGRLTDVTAAAAVDGDPPGVEGAWSTASAWADADGDGWLDLFVCNYVRWSPETDLFHTLDGRTKAYATPEPYRGESCRLYRNRGDGGFEDVTAASGLGSPEGKALGIAVTDLDGDARPDVLVANDTEPNFLFRNLGEGRFEEIGATSGVAWDEFGRARAGMGIDVAWTGPAAAPTVAIGNFSQEPLALFREVGDGIFRDAAAPSGLASSTLLPLTFGVRFVDVDLDGDEDLVLANGHIEPAISEVRRDVSFAQPPQLFMADRAGSFTPAAPEATGDLAEPLVGRGLATADYDRDGDPDLLITANGGAPRLLRNETDPAPDRWIRFRLQGAHPNLDAVGAVVRLWAGGREQRREIRTGGSYLSQSELRSVTFGLGEAAGVDSVRVRWPWDGGETRLVAPRPGTEHRIRQPEPAALGGEGSGG